MKHRKINTVFREPGFCRQNVSIDRAFREGHLSFQGYLRLLKAIDILPRERWIIQFSQGQRN